MVEMSFTNRNKRMEQDKRFLQGQEQLKLIPRNNLFPVLSFPEKFRLDWLETNLCLGELSGRPHTHVT